MSNLLFDWGNRTPEEQALQRRLEQEALFEKLVRIHLHNLQADGADAADAGNGGDGGEGSTGGGVAKGKTG